MRGVAAGVGGWQKKGNFSGRGGLAGSGVAEDARRPSRGHTPLRADRAAAGGTLGGRAARGRGPSNGSGRSRCSGTRASSPGRSRSTGPHSGRTRSGLLHRRELLPRATREGRERVRAGAAVRAASHSRVGRRGRNGQSERKWAIHLFTPHSLADLSDRCVSPIQSIRLPSFLSSPIRACVCVTGASRDLSSPGRTAMLGLARAPSPDVLVEALEMLRSRRMHASRNRARNAHEQEALRRKSSLHHQ